MKIHLTHIVSGLLRLWLPAAWRTAPGLVLGAVLGAVLAGGTTGAVAQSPLYIVNGRICTNDEVSEIAPADIEQVDTPDDLEEQIARYGEAAMNGVVFMTLRYDTAARFEADTLSFSRYIGRRVLWADDEPVARVVLRYRITATGDTEIDTVLEATDKRLLRRVRQAVAEAPKWQPAQKCGEAVESSGILRVQLPEGRRMPRQVELVIR